VPEKYLPGGRCRVVNHVVFVTQRDPIHLRVARLGSTAKADQPAGATRLTGYGDQGNELASDLSLVWSGPLPFLWMGCTLANNREDGRHAVAVTE
jgi:hypothetical protein